MNNMHGRIIYLHVRNFVIFCSFLYNKQISLILTVNVLWEFVTMYSNKKKILRIARLHKTSKYHMQLYALYKRVYFNFSDFKKIDSIAYSYFECLSS